MKKTVSVPALGPPHPEATLARSASVPATAAAGPPPSEGATEATLASFKRAGSLLFNEVLRGNKYSVPSLAEQNNNIISQLPAPKTSTNTARAAQSAKLKTFLQRLPVVRFVPKKSSVRAITNLRTRRPAGQGQGTYGSSNNAFTSSTGQTFGEVLTNSALYNCLHVLKSVYSADPALAGFGAFGLDDIYLKLLKYKQQLVASRPNLFAGPECATSVVQPQNEDDQSSRKDGSPTSAPEPTSDGLPPPPPSPPSPPPKFFVAVLDLEKCYDNVNPQKLYDLLRQILARNPGGSVGDGEPITRPSTSSRAATVDAARQATEKRLAAENVIHKYSVTHPIKSMDRNISKNVRCVTAAGEIVSFQEAAAEIAHYYPYSIITDNVVYPKVSNQEVLRLLRVHLFQHAVKIPATPSATATSGTSSDGAARAAESHFEYFTQVKGIPQGSVLSPLLCTFYYGDAERNIFSRCEVIEQIGLVDRTVVIRLMDDYIVISVDQSCVECFLQLAHQSLKQYGAGVNPLKTKVNFQTSVVVDGERIALQKLEGDEMPWCGLIVNAQTLEVTCHFARLLDRPLVHSVMVECSQTGAALRRAIKTFMRMKCHAIVLDAALNGKRTVVQTLYTMYLIVALRTEAYLDQLRTTLPPIRNHRHLLRCIIEGVTFGTRLIRTRTVKKVVRRLEISSGAGNYEDQWAQQEATSNQTSQPSPDEPDLPLFTDCVAAADPDRFGSCEVSFAEVSACLHRQVWGLTDVSAYLHRVVLCRRSGWVCAHSCMFCAGRRLGIGRSSAL